MQAASPQTSTVSRVPAPASEATIHVHQARGLLAAAQQAAALGTTDNTPGGACGRSSVVERHLANVMGDVR